MSKLDDKLLARLFEGPEGTPDAVRQSMASWTKRLGYRQAEVEQTVLQKSLTGAAPMPVDPQHPETVERAVASLLSQASLEPTQPSRFMTGRFAPRRGNEGCERECNDMGYSR